ncbi:MAG TPA: nicotinate-nucleotide adenylyltransferase [Saliniramus sp.]|nr:nicotinate-nucleotide adenylyltransferase [Saliniramus sp.]
MIRLPPHAPGMRIGLFGGSFNPPHEGHLHVGRMALRRLQLDQLWWLVTPGNPLKERHGLASLEERLEAARRLARHPRIAVTDIEAQLGVRYTIDTIRRLRARCPTLRFVWIMGADSLANFHRWGHWREIAGLVPIAVIDRPGLTLKAVRSPAAQALSPFRIPEHAAATLAARKPPAWVFLHGPRSNLSSTAIRAANGG